ncbi:hypothetical protein ACQKPE_10865 [Pseudomonas sp. NPDC089554]|uniref:hypothetical protein n=1 Tax=Pseudomonas sp. NPDC089554 TaxID=3390653 RepID=UPI003D06CE5B
MTTKVESTPSKDAIGAKNNNAAFDKEVDRATSKAPKKPPTDELGRGMKRPEGDTRTAQQIIDDTPLLKYLGNQSGVKDNLKKQVGDFDTDPDAAYRASKVLEHVERIDENGNQVDSTNIGNEKIDGFTKDKEARHGTEAGRLQDFGKYGYSSLKGEVVKSDLGKNQKRPEGDTRSAQQIIDDTPLLKYLGNQSNVKDNLKKQVGDFEKDPDAAYRASQVVEHVTKLDENGKLIEKSKDRDDDKINGFTKDKEARHGTEAGRLQDFGKYGYSSLKGDLIHVKPKTHTDKAPPPDEPEDVQALRDKYQIPTFGAEGLMDMELTNDKTVGGQTAENFVNNIKEDIKNGKLAENSDEAKLVKLMEAQASLDNGYELYGYAEGINLGSGTYRESDKSPTKLTGHDVKEIVDEDKLAKEISTLMSKESIKERYDKELKHSVSGLSEERLTEVREQVFPALFKEGSRDANLDFEDYVIAMNDSGDPKKVEIAELDVDRYFESLRILEPDSYAARRQTFDQNMMTHQLNTYIENPDKIEPENAETGLRLTVTILKGGINAVLGGLDKGDKSYDLYKKMLDEVDILDGHIKGLTPGENSKIAAAVRLAAQSGDAGAIDKVVDNQLKGLANNREETAGSLKKLLHTASSTGSLGAMSGTMNIVSSAMQLANGGGWNDMTDDQKLAAVRDLVGGLSSTNDFLKFGSNIVETLGGKHSFDPAVDVDGKQKPKVNATQWLGLLDENFPDVWGKDKIGTSDALADAISNRVKSASATLDKLDVGNLTPTELKEYDQTVKSLGEKMGVKDIPGGAPDAKKPSFAAAAGRSFLRFMGGSGLDLTGGVMDIVSGARKLKNAKTALEKADAGISLGAGISGTGMAVSNTIAMFAPKGAHLAGKLAGDVASTVVRGLAMGSRIAGPVFAVAGVVFGVAGTLIAEAVEHAKMQKLTDSQGQFFKDLAGAGVTKDDWGDKLEYARYATYMYGDRDTPDDKSMFDYQSAEWQHFQETEDHKGSSLSRLAPYLHKDGDPDKKNLWEQHLAGSTTSPGPHGHDRKNDNWRPWGDTDMDAGSQRNA